MALINMVFGRILTYLAESPLMTVYAFFCAVVLYAVFQIFLVKAGKKEAFHLSVGHFVWVYVFLFYLLLVYLVTGIGTVWIIGRYHPIIRAEQIHLVPFSEVVSLGSLAPCLLNVLMMVPLGFLLPLIWAEMRSIKKVALAGFLLSLAIELSQLFNLRATTTEDLITNTLGAVIGCLLFKLLYRLFRKSGKPAPKPKSPLIRYEAAICLLCSFVGMFLFFNPLTSLKLPARQNDVKESSVGSLEAGSEAQEKPSAGDGVDDSPEAQAYLKGIVLEVFENAVKLEKTETWETDAGMISVNTKEEIMVFFNETTKFELWRSNAAGTIGPIISETIASALAPKGIIEIFGSQEAEGFSADRVIIWRFDA